MFFLSYTSQHSLVSAALQALSHPQLSLLLNILTQKHSYLQGIDILSLYPHISSYPKFKQTRAPANTSPKAPLLSSSVPRIPPTLQRQEQCPQNAKLQRVARVTTVRQRVVSQHVKLGCVLPPPDIVNPGRMLQQMAMEADLGPHWTGLYTEAQNAINEALSGDDHLLSRAFNAGFDGIYSIAPVRPDETREQMMVRILAHFLDHIGAGRREAMDGTDAIFWLADAGWNLERALHDFYAEEEESPSTESSSEAEV